MANMRSKRRDRLLGAFVEPELKDRFEAEAARRGMTTADLLRERVVAYLATDVKRKDYGNGDGKK